jgi:hypothetical protein
MHFLAEGATFAPGTALQPGHLSLPLAPLAPTDTFEMRISDITRVAAAEAMVRGTVPLLSFADFTGRMFALGGHFEPALTHDPETFASTAPFFSATFVRLPKTFAVASTFLFFRTSAETCTR